MHSEPRAMRAAPRGEERTTVPKEPSLADQLAGTLNPFRGAEEHKP